MMTRAEQRHAIEMWNLTYRENVEVLSVAVPLYVYVDNGIFYVPGRGNYLTQTHRPAAVRNFILIDGQVVTEGLTDYMLARTIEEANDAYGYGRDVIMFLSGQPGYDYELNGEYEGGN